MCNVDIHVIFMIFRTHWVAITGSKKGATLQSIYKALLGNLPKTEPF